jgi:RNA polymerase sigma factor (TIGR02999 family)
MRQHGTADVTKLLIAWRNGDTAALDRVMPLVHAELHQIARRCMAGEHAGHSLQPTALVHEAFLRLVDVRRLTWQNRTHFLAMAARLMRRVLVDAARARRSRKRGAGAVRVTFRDDLPAAAHSSELDLVVLDDALDRLAQIDERKARGVDLRFFGGLTVDEIALCLEVSPQTVMRDWKFAKAWLLRELGTRRVAR